MSGVVLVSGESHSVCLVAVSAVLVDSRVVQGKILLLFLNVLPSCQGLFYLKGLSVTWNGD